MEDSNRPMVNAAVDLVQAPDWMVASQKHLTIAKSLRPTSDTSSLISIPHNNTTLDQHSAVPTSASLLEFSHPTPQWGDHPLQQPILQLQHSPSQFTHLYQHQHEQHHHHQNINTLRTSSGPSPMAFGDESSILSQEPTFHYSFHCPPNHLENIQNIQPQALGRPSSLPSNSIFHQQRHMPMGAMSLHKALSPSCKVVTQDASFQLAAVPSLVHTQTQTQTLMPTQTLGQAGAQVHAHAHTHAQTQTPTPTQAQIHMQSQMQTQSGTYPCKIDTNMAPSHSGHDTFNLFLVSDSNEPQPPARRASEKQVRSLTVATNNLALSTPATSPSTTESLAQSVLKFDVHPNANVIVNASNNAHGNANVNTNTDTYNNGGNTKGKKRYGSMSEDLHQLIEGHVSESDDTSPPPQPPPPSMMRKKPAIKLSRDKLCRVPLATLPTTTSTAATMTRPHSFLIAPSASEYCFPLIPRRYSTTSVTVTGSNGSLGGGGGGQSSGAVVAHPSSISQSPSPRPPISLQRTHSSDSFRALSETPMHTQYQQHLFKATHSSNSVMQQQQGPFDQQQSQWQQLQNATLFDSQGLLLAMRNPGGIGNAETLPPQQLHPSQPPAQAFLSNSSNPTSHSFMRPPHPLQQQPQQQHGPLPFVQLPTSSGYHAHTQQLALTTGLTRFPEQPNLIAPGLDFHLDLDLDLDFADPYLSVLDLNHRSQQGDGTGPISSSSTVGQQTIVEQNQEQYDITALIPPSSSSSSATTTATTTTTTTTITTSSTTAIPIQNIQNTQNTPHPNRIRVDSEADGGSMSKKTVLERNMEYIEPSSAVLQEHYQQKRRFSVEYLSQVSNSSNSSSSNGSSSSSSTRQAQRQEVQYQAQNQEVPHDMEQDGMASSSKSFGNEEAKSDDLAGDDGVEKDDGNVEGDEDSQRVDEEEDEEEKEEEEKDEEEMVVRVVGVVEVEERNENEIGTMSSCNDVKVHEKSIESVHLDTMRTEGGQAVRENASVSGGTPSTSETTTASTTTTTQPTSTRYECLLCNRHYTRPFNLRSHMLVHEDKKPFACTLCDTRFTRRHDMVRHVKTRHRIKETAVAVAMVLPAARGQKW